MHLRGQEKGREGERVCDRERVQENVDECVGGTNVINGKRD